MKQDDFNANSQKYRSSMEIVAKILTIIVVTDRWNSNDNFNIHRHSINKREIMHKVHLSHTQLEKFLSVLVEKGLLLGYCDNNNKEDYTYRITEKGRNYLRKYNELVKDINSGQMIGHVNRSC